MKDNAGAAVFRLAGLLVFASACGSSPTAPGSVQTTFTVTNGWTREPVAGATVSAGDGMVAHTDASGRLQLRKTGSCLTVAVHATGFLERRTCTASEVTLWPIADAQEMEATRTAAFYHDQLRAEWWSVPFDVTFATELRARGDVQETWVAAAYEIAQLTGGRISFRFVESVGEGYIIAPASFPTVCSDGPRWPIETGGFCTEQTPGYFVDQIIVLPGRLTDRSVALRALLSVVGGIIPHSLPGLMNTSRPDSELSAFERKTLHMIGLRRSVNVEWPDFDQIPR